MGGKRLAFDEDGSPAQVSEPIKLAKKAKVAKDVTADTKAIKSDVPLDTAVEAFMKEHEIAIDDPKAAPCLHLSEAPFPASLVSLLMKQNFPAPSAVQAAGWPLAVSGRDVLAIAKTGSGKTLGYLLPALTRCQAERTAAKGAPTCLVMAPTRELVLQIQAEATRFGAAIGCKAVAVYGGAPKWGQVQQLQRGADIVIATPGRMMDMLDLHGAGAGPSTSLKACNMLVLDEADRMLDMGFEWDIRTIVWEMPTTRQTLLFSATWPKAVQKVAADLLQANRVKVTVGTGGNKLTANKSIEQRVQVVTESAKWDAFLKLLETFKPGAADAGKRVIVFSNTKRDVNWIGQHCWDNGFSVDTVSGDRTQSQRESVIKQFRAGSVTMVIATDVAARGLDINGIERVINYDFPGPDDYIHRIGRTGRAGASGVADTLFTAGDRKHAKELARILEDAGQQVPAELKAFTAQRQWW
ncbi:hypothetical protein CYMTET_10454 [Cymbomonas tetramitiformis]|uniref:RNA helicase n=1 Tax=Cymbomonas tetramitiformis TaxID=36881 RepID=A0AAE0LE63_9CHLO|nr:hypothetical protein CYMTET_10454 [Cymbomonas tetramitiformis]|eukprot:gene16290-19331_t